VTSRTVLALSAAVLALSACTVGVDAGPGTGRTSAAAAAELGAFRPYVEPPRVTTAKLKRVDSVELDAESLVFRRGGTTVAETSMRDSRTTVSLLNRLLGTPSRTQTAVGDGGACFPSGTTYTWGGAIRVAAMTTPAQTGNAVEVRVLRDGVRSRFDSRVDLTGPRGVQVGDDIAHEIDDAPASERVSFGDGDSAAWQLLLEEGWAATADDDARGDDAEADDGRADSVTVRPESTTDDTGTNGVSALTDGTTVTVIGSPMPVHAQRGC